MRNLILPALLLASAFQTALGATSGVWVYSVANNEATITGYTGTGGAVSIPSSVGGYPVIKVGNVYPPVFGAGNTSVTSLIIPNSVTSIGTYAFQINSGLTSVTIGSGVTSIGDNAFQGCTGLTSLTIGSGVTSIGKSAFQSCTGLTSLTIPNSVITIGQEAFSGCYSLRSITIPNSVTTIPYSMCYSCTGLTSLTIGSGVTSIGDNAFAQCWRLSLITIPNGVTRIGQAVFEGCTGLTSLTIGSGVTSIGNGAFQGCTGLASLIVPNNVTSIGNSAFVDCTGLTSVTVPERFIGQIAQIGISGQVATDYLINALANNDAFITAVANKIKATGGNYGLSVKSELESLATKSGLSSAIEPLATKSELTSSLTQSRTDGINSVLSNPNLWTLYTTSQIQNMAVGDLVLTRQESGGFVLNYDIEQSTDLQNWTRYEALSLPLTRLPTDKAFVRIKAKQ